MLPWDVTTDVAVRVPPPTFYAYNCTELRSGRMSNCQQPSNGRWFSIIMLTVLVQMKYLWVWFKIPVKYSHRIKLISSGSC